MELIVVGVTGTIMALVLLGMLVLVHLLFNKRL